MDQPPAVAFTAFAEACPRAIETEIGAALYATGRGKGLWRQNEVRYFCKHEYYKLIGKSTETVVHFGQSLILYFEFLGSPHKAS